MLGDLVAFAHSAQVPGSDASESLPSGLIGQVVSQRGGLIEQGPLYYVSLTVYVSLFVYLLPISKY